MPTARPFAYNPGSPISGTIQVGDLAVGTPTTGFTDSPQFWNGPDEELGYVIAVPVPDNTQPTPISGVFASVKFFRTSGFTDNSFINLSEYVSGKFNTPQTFTGATEASTWLTTNGFWNSYDSVSYNFDADSSDWAAAGVTDQTSFNSVFGVTTDNFILSGNNIKANIISDIYVFGVFNGGNKNITNFNYLTNNTLFNGLSLGNNNIIDFNPTIALPNIIQSISLNDNQIENFNPSIPLPPIDSLNLNNNQIVILNPTIPLPTTILQLYLSDNLMTLSSYTALETWANSLPIGGGYASFSGNVDSVSGTNLAAILISKGWFVDS